MSEKWLLFHLPCDQETVGGSPGLSKLCPYMIVVATFRRSLGREIDLLAMWARTPLFSTTIK
jgi:hypothetical protein